MDSKTLAIVLKSILELERENSIRWDEAIEKAIGGSDAPFPGWDEVKKLIADDIYRGYDEACKEMRLVIYDLLQTSNSPQE